MERMICGFGLTIPAYAGTSLRFECGWSEVEQALKQ